MRRVAELGSLIWLEYVKQAGALLSESFHFLPVCGHRGFSESETGTLSTAVINAEIRESTRGVHTPRSYQQVTVRRGAWLSLGTRIGLVTASNDHRVLRLTGSLPLLQKSLAGVVMSVGSFFVFP